jgi:putative sterol carrier protein
MSREMSAGGLYDLTAGENEPQGACMTDGEVGTERTLGELARRGREPTLASRSGTVRIELTRGGKTRSWRVTVARGEVAVTRGAGKADTVIRADADVFDGIAEGRVNAMTAHLRGLVTVEGDAGLALVLERLLPGPPDRVILPWVHR